MYKAQLNLVNLEHERQRDNNSIYSLLFKYNGCHKLIKESEKVFLVKEIYHCSKAKEITKVSRIAGLIVIKVHLSHSAHVGIKCHVAINYLGQKFKARANFSTSVIRVIIKKEFQITGYMTHGLQQEEYILTAEVSQQM